WDLRTERTRRNFSHVYSSSRISCLSRLHLCHFWHGALPYRIDRTDLCRSGDLLVLRGHCSATSWAEICKIGILASGAVPVSCRLLCRRANRNPRSVLHVGSIGFRAGCIARIRSPSVGSVRGLLWRRDSAETRWRGAADRNFAVSRLDYVSQA